METPLAMTGFGVLSRLGHDLASHREALAITPPPFASLDRLHPSLPAVPSGWITPRSLLVHRLWSPLSMAALHVARQALDQAAWSKSETREAALFFASSRGPGRSQPAAFPGRRPFPLMAASNSLLSEPLAALARQLGTSGPSHALSSGCCAGSDALALAAQWIRSGLSPRALVVAAELPLDPDLLDDYARTRILASGDPPQGGLVPAEAAAAICLEPGGGPAFLDAYSATECDDPLAGARSDRELRRLLTRALQQHGTPDQLLPHASGTPRQQEREPELLRELCGQPGTPLKPWTGHTIGASGLLETAFAAAGALPGARGLTFKLSSALGGRHSLVVFRIP